MAKPVGKSHGERLKAARIRLGLSQAEAAARIGMPFQNLSGLERGKPATLDLIYRIATALGADPHEIDPRLASIPPRPPIVLAPQFETAEPDCSSIVFVGEVAVDIPGREPVKIVARRSAVERLIQDALGWRRDVIVRSGQEPRRPDPPAPPEPPKKPPRRKQAPKKAR